MRVSTLSTYDEKLLLAQAFWNGTAASASAMPGTVGVRIAATSTARRIEMTRSCVSVRPTVSAALASTASMRRLSSGSSTGSISTPGPAPRVR